MLIAIEGGDAAGKYTQTTKLAEVLPATRFAFPNYESPTGKLILSHLKKDWWPVQRDTDGRGPVFSVDAAGTEMDARIFQSLQTVNRLELLPIIRAAAQQGHIVLDRYWQSACVYGALDGLDEAWLRLVQESPMPPADINILIDVPVEEGFKRRPERRDRYEMNREFLERVRRKYIELWGAGDLIDGMLCWQTRPGWFYVDGRGTADEVHSSILEIIAKKQTGVLK